MSCVWRHRALRMRGARHERCIDGSSFASLKTFKDNYKITTTNCIHQTLKVSNDRALPSELRHLWPSSTILYVVFRTDHVSKNWICFHLQVKILRGTYCPVIVFQTVSCYMQRDVTCTWYWDRILSRTLRYCPFWKYSSLDVTSVDKSCDVNSDVTATWNKI